MWLQPPLYTTPRPRRCYHQSCLSAAPPSGHCLSPCDQVSLPWHFTSPGLQAPGPSLWAPSPCLCPSLGERCADPLGLWQRALTFGPPRLGVGTPQHRCQSVALKGTFLGAHASGQTAGKGPGLHCYKDQAPHSSPPYAPACQHLISQGCRCCPKMLLTPTLNPEPAPRLVGTMGTLPFLLPGFLLSPAPL